MRKVTILLLISTVVYLGSCTDRVVKKSIYDHGGFTYKYNSHKSYYEYYGPDKKKIANIYFFDNGPDYFSQGLRRIVDNKKIGFINKKNQIVIPAQFDFAFPFANGFAVIIKNPIYTKMGEHTAVSGGKYGLVNKKGKRVVPMKYDAIVDYNLHRAVVRLGQKRIVLKY